MGRPEFLQVISEICSRRGWNIAKLSQDWILRISDAEKKRTTNIFGYVFDVNPAAAAELCKEKAAAAQVLALEGIAHIEHEVFLAAVNKQMKGFVPSSGVWPQLIDFAKKHDYNIVVKPLKGTGGNGVYKIANQRDLEEAAHDIYSVEYGLAACPYVDIVDEFRVIWLGYPRLIYRKVRASVVGDGTSTVQQLAAQVLAEMDPNKVVYLAQALADGPLSRPEKAKRVPAKGELVALQWKHNLGHGASPEVLSEDHSQRNDLIDLASRAVEAVGMKFCSVDIISTADGGYRVMEVNCGVMMDSAIEQCPNGHELATSIYEEAIETALYANSPKRGRGKENTDNPLNGYAIEENAPPPKISTMKAMFT